MKNGKAVLKVGSFATIKDSTMAEYGVKKGQTVYIAGQFHMAVEDNPYLHQTIFICAPVDSEGHIDNGIGKGITINPKRLVAVSSVVQERLEVTRDTDYKVMSDASPD